MRKNHKRALIVAVPVVGFMTGAALVVPAMAAGTSAKVKVRSDLRGRSGLLGSLTGVLTGGSSGLLGGVTDGSGGLLGSVTGTLGGVTGGEVDAGIGYVTDAKAGAASAEAVEIADPYNVVAEYPVAVLKQSANSNLAYAFLDYILGSDAQAVLAKYGFAGA